MKCENCGKEGAVFTGSAHSYPHPDDCENTPENLPLGKAWLCDECLGEAYAADMKIANEQTAGDFYEAFTGITEAEFMSAFPDGEEDHSGADFNSNTRKPADDLAAPALPAEQINPTDILLEAMKAIGWGSFDMKVKYIDENGRPFDFVIGAGEDRAFSVARANEYKIIIARIALQKFESETSKRLAPIAATPFRDFVDANFDPAPAKINRRQVHAAPDIAPTGPDLVEQEFNNECAEDSRADMI